MGIGNNITAVCVCAPDMPSVTYHTCLLNGKHTYAPTHTYTHYWCACPPLFRSIAKNLVASAGEWLLDVYFRSLFLLSCAREARRQAAQERKNVWGVREANNSSGALELINNSICRVRGRLSVQGPWGMRDVVGVLLRICMKVQAWTISFCWLVLWKDLLVLLTDLPLMLDVWKRLKRVVYI